MKALIIDLPIRLGDRDQRLVRGPLGLLAGGSSGSTCPDLVIVKAARLRSLLRWRRAWRYWEALASRTSIRIGSVAGVCSSRSHAIFGVDWSRAWCGRR